MTRTLADMTPSERQECVGMWCDNLVSAAKTPDPVVLACVQGERCWILHTTLHGNWSCFPLDAVAPRSDLPRAWTPSGEPVPESTPEPEQPRSEDVKPDPQPGEAWLIEYEGKRYEAIYWYSPLYAHWVFVRNREGTVYIESHEATPVSRLVGEAVPSHPSVLLTEEDYENAPTGTIAAGDYGDPWVKDDLGFWLVGGGGGSEISRLMAFDARRVLRWGETL